MWQAGPQRARPPSLVEDRVCSRSQAGLGQEPTARCSEDRLPPLPHGRSQCGRRLGGRCGHRADPLLHGSGSKEHNQAAFEGRTAPSPAIAPLGVRPTAPPVPGRWPLLRVPHEGCSRNPGHGHTTATRSAHDTCQRRTDGTHARWQRQRAGGRLASPWPTDRHAHRIHVYVCSSFLGHLTRHGGGREAEFSPYVFLHLLNFLHVSVTHSREINKTTPFV